MDAILRNLRTLIDQRGLKQSAIAKVAGVSEGSVSGWLSGRAIPRTKPLERIADYYRITMDDLVSESAGLYAKAHGLTDAPPNALAVAEPRRAYAPLLGRVHAGDACEPDVLDSEVPLPYEVWERHPQAYFLEVEGTCMDRVYPAGCMVLVDPSQTPQNGHIAVVSIDGADYVMRRLYVGSSALMLVAESYGSWDDIVVQGDHEVRFVGTVVWYQPCRELA